MLCKRGMLHERVGVEVSTEYEEINDTRRTTIAKLERSALCSLFEELDCRIHNKDIDISRGDEYAKNIVDARHTWYDIENESECECRVDRSKFSG